MAFKLTKDEVKTRDEINDDLQGAWSKVEEAVNKYNAAMDEAKGDVEQAVEKFNEVVERSNEFTGGVAQRAEDEFDERSENWQSGEKGDAASTWKDEWANAELEALDIDWPEELSIDQPEIDLTALSEEAES